MEPFDCLAPAALVAAMVTCLEALASASMPPRANGTGRWNFRPRRLILTSCKR
jgi:hypothetical protein